MSKIKTRNKIEQIALSLKKEGKTIVTTNGSFDLMHIGHIKFLQEAKEQGDVLIVGLNSNASIKKYKSEDRPIIDEVHRSEMLEALSCVNYIVLMDEYDISVPLIKLIKPHVHANGVEYGPDCIEAQAIKEASARLHIVKLYQGFSTTNLIEKICSVFGK